MRSAPLLLLAALSAPALAGDLTSGSSPAIPWLRLLLSFAFCIALAGGAALLLKRRHTLAAPLKRLAADAVRSGPRRMAIVETRRANLHVDLCLVEYDGEVYFLALTPAGASVLSRSRPAMAAE